LIKEFTRLIIKTPQSADQKLLIVKKSKALATKYNNPMLIITTKAPSDRNIKGNDKSLTAGFISAFTRPSNAPAFSKLIKFVSNVIPEINQAAI